jgi:ABC-type lipoprotein release transport system permease subunit
VRLVGVELRRHAGRLILGGAGVVVGIAALVFFLGLAMGIRQVVLGDLFPLDRLEVEPRVRDLDVLMLRFALGSDTIDQEKLDRLAALPDVAAVYPKMKVTVPVVASGGGSLLGTRLQTEIVADGIDPALVVDDVGDAFRWSELDPAVPCRSGRECPRDTYCGDGTYGRVGECRQYLPVLLSPHLLEIYNGSLRRAYNLPRLNPEAAVGFDFEMAFGASTLRRTTPGHAVLERARVVGFSDRAIALGVTLPLEFVRDLTVGFSSSKAAGAYHSAIVEVADRTAVAAVVEEVQSMNLVVTDHGAQRVATLVAISIVLIGFMGGAVVAIASLSVGHVFMVIVLHRQREIGVLRAVGASKVDIGAAILAQAAIVGGAGGVLGFAVAVAAGRLVDSLAAARIPDFPYKPETFFLFPGWMLIGAVAVAVLACVVGAAVPAARAVRRDPAEVLAIP